MSEPDCRVIRDTFSKDGGTIEELRLEVQRQRFVIALRIERAIEQTSILGNGGAGHPFLVRAMQAVVKDLRAGKI